jgi:hypothetical protein
MNSYIEKGDFMPTVDIKGIVSQTLQAIEKVLGSKYKEAAIFAENESNKFVQDMAQIGEWKIQGKITESEAASLVSLHKRSYKMVLTSLEGISLIVAENAINSAIGATANSLNKMIGWEIF